VTAARGFSLVEILVATFILAVGLVAVATGLQYATSSVDIGRRETVATFLAEQRMESLRSSALADWASPVLVAGISSEPYGAIPGAPGYRRDTAVSDLGGDDCTDPAPVATTCKRVRVTVYYRPVTGTGGVDQERRVDLLTVLVSRA
jgi:prepilin-type N-terminal cleavage/methylation domain-containing protein